MYTNYTSWTDYSIFFSAEDTQKMLKKAYEKALIENADQKSFENCYPFIYYLEHAQIYYEQATKSPMLIQPILIFYGFVHLIKACILTIQPTYPENTSVLAHGVSTRKRKKQQYHFFQDEVKIQKNGLFTFIAEKMFHMKHLEGEKVNMGDLLKLIPELNGMYYSLEDKSSFLKINQKEEIFSFPNIILDHYHMTESRFKDYYQSKSQAPVQFIDNFNKEILFRFKLHKVIDPIPLKFNFEEGEFYFPILKNELLHFPEILIHYLLLYNLSMIARYETEWWSELIKIMPTKDYPFIKRFLNISLHKGPFLIYQFLNSHLK